MCDDQTTLLPMTNRWSVMTEAVMLTLAKLHYLQDAYTVGHSHRVGLISKAIASEMGWGEELCNRMYYLGLLHDIGKMAIPYALLHKKEKLIDDELTKIKKHVEYTHDLLKAIPFEFPLAEIVAQHHERIDGSGYPHGLSADQIYPEAKVLIVADVFESMVNRRSYREGLGLEKAVNEIIEGKGRIYDEHVCEALLRLLDQRNYQCPTEEFNHF